MDEFFAREKPDYVFLAAASVGGIHANNTYPADFIRENLTIQTNIIDASYRNGATKLLFLGSSCIYPRDAPQPIAKIAGIKMCQAYRRQYGFDAISLMPTNLYGPGDNFHPENSHVLPALIQRFHKAKEAGEPKVILWGTGKPRREFLHADDLAAATVFLMERYNSERIVNVGAGRDITIRELGEIIKSLVGFEGAIEFDPSMPDGTPRKLLDIKRIEALGWRPRISLREGIASAYAWYLRNIAVQGVECHASSARRDSVSQRVGGSSRTLNQTP